MKREMKDSNDLFKKHLGISPSYFRFPYGSLDGTTLRILYNWGYRAVRWNLDTWDWELDNPENNPKLIVEK